MIKTKKTKKKSIKNEQNLELDSISVILRFLKPCNRVIKVIELKLQLLKLVKLKSQWIKLVSLFLPNIKFF